MKESINNNLQKARIASAYGLCENPDISKGGEGSRGGKVIGYTKSGKPIYQVSYHAKASRGIQMSDHQANKHSEFNNLDHQDAAELHGTLIKQKQEKLEKLKQDPKKAYGPTAYNLEKEIMMHEESQASHNGSR